MTLLLLGTILFKAQLVCLCCVVLLGLVLFYGWTCRKIYVLQLMLVVKSEYVLHFCHPGGGC